MNLLLEWAIFRGYVCFREGTSKEKNTGLKGHHAFCPALLMVHLDTSLAARPIRHCVFIIGFACWLFLATSLAAWIIKQLSCQKNIPKIPRPLRSWVYTWTSKSFCSSFSSFSGRVLRRAPGLWTAHSSLEKPFQSLGSKNSFYLHFSGENWSMTEFKKSQIRIGRTLWPGSWC